MGNLPEAVEQYLVRCFAAGIPPRVDELARELALHPSALSRDFKLSTGSGLSLVLKNAQVEEAKRLLSSTRLGIHEIARRAGFGTPNTPFRIFRARVGMTPDHYRRTASRA